MRTIKHWFAALGLAFVATPGLLAGGQQPFTGQPPVSIEERARGAERVVVATVTDVTARYERNEFGDELIVSRATLAVEEALKGGTEAATLEYEGGTVGGIALHVSSLPALARGERAVFFMTRGKRGELRPHLKGQGILKLDRTNHVQGSSLTLDDVRRMSHGQGRQGGGN
jgi:hypothetical protein